MGPETGALSGFEKQSGLDINATGLARSGKVQDEGDDFCRGNLRPRKKSVSCFFSLITDARGMFVNNTIYASIVTSIDGPQFGIYGPEGTFVLINNIIWGVDWEEAIVLVDTTPQYNCISNMGVPGNGNISDDPLFLDPGKGDFRLQPNSPCIDAGMSIPGLRDFLGTLRPVDGTDEPRGDGSGFDMGAFEFQGE